MDDNCTSLVTISCANHHEKLVRGLWNSLITQHHELDFNLQFDNQSVRAHRLIVDIFLAPVKLAVDVEKVETSSEMVPQFLEDVVVQQRQPQDPSNGGRDTLDFLLEFLYNGSVTLPEQRRDKLLDAAKFFNFEMLVDAVNETVASDNKMPSRRTLRQRKTIPVKLPNEKDKIKLKKERKYQNDNRMPKVKKNRPTANKNTKNNSIVLTHESQGDEFLYTDNKSNCSSQSSRDNQPNIGCIKVKEIEGKITSVNFGGSINNLSKPTGKTPSKRNISQNESINLVYQCQHCNFNTKRKIIFEVHQAKHDPTVELFPCNYCSKKFPSQNSLARHELHHSAVPYTHQCAHCPSKFRSKWAYNIHQSKHDPSIQVFRCDLCSHAFLNYSSLERHQLGHATYTCSHCEYATRKRWQYDDHLFSSHGVNAKGETMLRLQCEQCEYTCKTKQQINNHLIAHHSGTKPFKCEQCNFASGRKTDLHSHINVNHKGIKKELCDACGYRTVSKSKLDQHKLMHSGLKPYQCELCSARYSDRSSLKRHVNKHTNPHDQPYVCDLCGHRCNRRSNLKVHLKNVHKVIADEHIIGGKRKESSDN